MSKIRQDLFFNKPKRDQFNGYYLISNDYDQGLKMVIEGPWQDEYVEIINKKNITGLRLSASAKWYDTNINFIQNLTKIIELEIYSWKVTNVSPISSLTQLKHISLECNYRKPIDFTLFTNLQSCFLRWRPKSDTIFSVTTLRSLNIVNYPYEYLTPLSGLSRLTELKLTSNKLKSLMGIKKLKGLSVLDLYRCTKFETLDGIQCAKELNTVEIETCKKIKTLKPLGQLSQLTRLLINNCGKIQSLQPLVSCNKLSELFFIADTNIEDGNIDVLLQLPLLKKVGFANRRHYSHKCGEIESAIEK